MSCLRGSQNFIWDISKPLGQGATSTVYKGRNKGSGEEVAVKVFSQAGNTRPIEVQMREFQVMKKLRHKNIVQMLATDEEQGTRNKVIVMELTEFGSLYTLLEEPRNAYGLDEEEFLIVLDNVTSGMKYMRDNGIVHRDIKPGNILRYVGEDGRSVFKLTDFGAAKEIESEEEPFMSLYGTEEYLHPDMYERAVLRTKTDARPQFTSKVDLWSLGVTFFHVATGQLPFKPYGGRKNRTKMFEITRLKESGVIMGIQHTENGPIEWSKELPTTCRLSDGLKLLVTPIFARLLDSVPEKVWNFDMFFNTVESIIHKKVIHVFCPRTWNNLKVYIDGDKNLSTVQELIAEQTEIQSMRQLLIFDGQLMTDFIQPILPVSKYPEGISEINPIFTFSITHEDIGKFPQPRIKEFPKFTSTLTTEDYSIAKMCSAIACYIHKEVSLYCTKQELMRRAAHLYTHELYLECGHLIDYHAFLAKTFNTTTKWKDNFLQCIGRDLKMINVLVELAEVPLKNIKAELEERQSQCMLSIGRSSLQIIKTMDQLEDNLNYLKTEYLQTNSLKKEWKDSVGCISQDRCEAKVAVVLDQILKIKAQFSDDRKRPNLSFNEEQIHKYEKNRLSELCIRTKSLFFDHCLAHAQDQFNHFHIWFRKALELRQHIQQTEKKLCDLATCHEDFVQMLNELCMRYNDDLDRHIHNIEQKLQEKFMPVKPNLQQSLYRNIATSSNSRLREEAKEQTRRIMIQDVLQGLYENQITFNEMKEVSMKNQHILRSFSLEEFITSQNASTVHGQDF